MRKRNWFQQRSLFSTQPKVKVSSKWRIQYVLWKALKRTCTFLGAMVLISLLISSTITAIIFSKPDKPLNDRLVLFWHVKGSLIENTQTLSPLEYTASLKGQSPSIRQMVDALDRGGDDPRVKGFVVLLSHSALSMVHLHELHEAVKRFKSKGKFTYIVAPSYGQLGRGLGSYYFASSFDELWMHPVGTLSMTGIRFEVPLAKTALEKIGVETEFFQREEYKNVFETFTNDEISPHTEQALASIRDDIVNTLLSSISENRNIDQQTLGAQVDKGLLTADEALKATLIDQIGFTDELMAKVNEQVTGDPDTEEIIFVGTGRYLNKLSKEEKEERDIKEKEEVALIYVNGTIAQTEQMNSQYSFIGGNFVSVNKVAAAIMDAADSKTIKTIVLRINSPGGTPVAGDILHRTISRAKSDKGKNVIVSMGGVAASAGYWIAAPADRIFASPLTLTGSIGVAGGKFNLKRAWEKLGVNWHEIKWGENAGMLSVNEAFSASAINRMNVLMDKTYSIFLQRVADGRGLDLKDVKAVAKGRAWTGAQAIDKKLIDEIGGFSDALDYAATLSGGADRFDIDITVLPKQKTPLEQLVDLIEMQVHSGNSLNTKLDGLTSFLSPLYDSLFPYVISNDGMMALEKVSLN
jgi:protease-4